MAHYAFINSENIVVEVITGKNENDTDTLPEGFASWEEYYETKRDGLTCLRTSYNTDEGVHKNGGTAFRGNFAGIGFEYLQDEDIFIEQKPYESWVLNTSTASYEPPTSYPDDGNNYIWNESTTSWDLVS